MQYKKLAVCLVTSLGLSTTTYAKDLVPNEFSEAFKNGTPSLDFRLRYENAAQQGLQEAKATTLRTVAGYETAEVSSSTLKVELVDVANFFGQRYNPGVPELAKPTYSLIRDPKGAALTEGKLNFYGIDKNIISLGRQYIQLDNERFIGKNDFRQFPQSFDAISISNTMIDSVNVYYAFLTHVNTNTANGRTGGRDNLRTHLVNVDWNGYTYGTLGGYAYFNKDRTVLTNSHIILGVRLNANEEQTGSFGYLLEIARQQGKFGNPNAYVAHYAHLKASKTIDMFTGIIGVERLGGSSSGANRSFITPLGSVDNFNGLAEVFTVTPNRGLQDGYASINLTSNDITLGLTYHYFRLDKGPGSRRAGQELDVTLHFKLNDRVGLGAAYAKYNPKNSFAPKTRRFWAMLTANML
jgi:hypothetical protein